MGTAVTAAAALTFFDSRFRFCLAPQRLPCLCTAYVKAGTAQRLPSEAGSRKALFYVEGPPVCRWVEEAADV